MNQKIADKLKLLPEQPGVYLMKNETGEIIYVGKAVSLKNRVRSYFQSKQHQLPKVLAMLTHVQDLEWIITDSEVEALILECNLIKKHRPTYNIRLKDDKQYPYIKVTVNEKYPRVFKTRTISKDGARYFGPYTNAGAVDETLKLLKRIFPLRTCKRKDVDIKSRPCLNAHINQCLAPCADQISAEKYNDMVKDITLFLDGRQEEVVKHIEKRMEEAAEALEFERAAVLRNQLLAVRMIVEKQKVFSDTGEDQDIIAFARGFNEVCVQIFFVRGGKMLGREHFIIGETDELSRQEIMTAFVEQYYNRVEFIPKEIILGEEVENQELIEKWLKEKRGNKVRVIIPKKGDKQKLVEMVAKNALQTLEERSAQMKQQKEMTEEAVVELQRELGLAKPPYRIECYDISNTQGTESVASMVVFENGRPKNSDYRRFKIKTVIGPNDFASMQEVVGRRLKRAKKELDELDQGSLAQEDINFANLPDLIVIDGGKGQLSAAREIMKELGFGQIPTFGLAKEFEYLFKEGYSEPIILPRGSKSLYLIQRIRDEAHRFAITFHRQLRSKRNLKSVLDDIPGIGEKRKKALLKELRSVEKIKQATVVELAAVDGMNVVAAEAVYQFFRR